MAARTVSRSSAGLQAAADQTAANQLTVGKSTVPGAGRGVFAATNIERGQVVCLYVGTKLKHNDVSCGEYMFAHSERVSYDAQNVLTIPQLKWKASKLPLLRTQRAVNCGRYLNDHRGSGRTPNAKFAECCGPLTDSRNKVFYAGVIRAKRRIAAGQEVLVHYGSPEYLFHHGKWRRK
jgi:hypothetical protein